MLVEVGGRRNAFELWDSLWKQGISLEGLFLASLRDGLPAPCSPSKSPSKSVVRTQRLGNSTDKGSLWTRDGHVYLAYNQIPQPHPRGAETQFEVTRRDPPPHRPGSFPVPPQHCGVVVVLVWAGGVVGLFGFSGTTTRQARVLQGCEASPQQHRPTHRT